jgi:hypothetical protein
MWFFVLQSAALFGMQQETNTSVPFSAIFGKANLFVPQVIPGYCDEATSPSGSVDCFMGEGLLPFGQSSYIGPFCHPQLQSSSADPKDYSSTGAQGSVC